MLEGRYANYFKVGFNDYEVVIDFGQHHGEEEAVMHTRIILSPVYLEALISMLKNTETGLSQFKSRQRGSKD